MPEPELLAPETFVLCDLVPADGRVSWLPAEAEGAEPLNEYLILDGDAALLIDTGLAAHRQSILSRARGLIGDRSLTIAITRIELDCIGNLAEAVAGLGAVEVLTGSPLSPFDLIHIAPHLLGEVRAFECPMGTNEPVERSWRRIRFLDAAVRLLGTSWLLDTVTSTLFTSDFFCASMLDHGELAPAGPGAGGRSASSGDGAGSSDGAGSDQGLGVQRLVSEGEDLDPQRLATHLLAKFDYLARARPELVLSRWDRFFEGLGTIEALAPGHGRPICGRRAASAAIDAYREALQLAMGDRGALSRA